MPLGWRWFGESERRTLQGKNDDVSEVAMKRLANIPLVLCLMVGLTACGEKQESIPPDQREQVKATPFPGAPEHYADTDALVWDEEPSWFLKGEEPIQLLQYQVVSDKQIRVFFETGNDGCYGAKYKVKETPDAIEVQVIVGTYITVSACSAEATFQSMLIDLKDPVGDREIRALTN